MLCRVFLRCERESLEERQRRGLSAEVFVNDQLSVHMNLDVRLIPDCQLAVNTFGAFFKKKHDYVYWLFLETIVPYFVLSTSKAFFFHTDGSRLLIGHLSVCFNGTDNQLLNNTETTKN